MVVNSSLQFGNSTIEYDVNFSRRKTAAIEVHPDQRVTVTVPEGSAQGIIEDLVHKRANWILKQLQLFSTYAPQELPRAYVSGESYRYLGRQYRLKVLDGETEGLKLERNLIYITVKDKNNTQRVQSIFEQWYRDESYRIFYERLDACYPRVKRLGVIYPSLSIRTMKTRWGSCTHSGLVLINPKLVQTPVDCIDYVILHELCHLKEHNHGKQFYLLLDQVLPGWRERRDKLNKFEFS
jgi:Predicted metal-dependent hydrolase